MTEIDAINIKNPSFSTRTNIVITISNVNQIHIKYIIYTQPTNAIMPMIGIMIAGG